MNKYKIKITALLFLVSLSCWSQKNQNEEIASMENTSYPVFKLVENAKGVSSMQQAKKPWPVQFIKEGDVVKQIYIKRVGIIDEYYDVDLPNFPAYYSNGNGDVNVSVIDKKIYYYHYSVKSGATIDYILSQNKVVSYAHEKEVLDSYRKKIKGLQTGARSERKEEKAELARLEAEANTLKGKSIKSMRIKPVKENQEMGLISMVGLGIEVTLTNGTVLKTKNLGGKTPYDDFGTSAISGEYAGGDFKITDNINDIVNHELSLKVWSKYDKSKSTQLTLPLNYKSTISYWFLGRAGGYNGANGTDGNDGHSVTIFVDEDVINGFKVYRLNFTDTDNGNSFNSIINRTSTITINTSGGKGGDGGNHASGEGGDGGDGGNAGSITLMGPGAQSININGLTSGGIGGRAGSGEGNARRGYSGRNGSSGKINRN